MHRSITFLVRLALRSPRALGSARARWVVNLLALAGAAMLVWSAVIHLKLWGNGYREIHVIGPLFLAQGIGCIVLALVLLGLRWLVLLLAGAVTLAATAAGLLVAVYHGMFGFIESLSAPYTMLSLWVEFVGAGILLLAAVVLALVRRASVPANPEPARARTLRRGARSGTDRDAGRAGAR